MIENILLFVRNCVMAVLTAWAGIQIAENAQSKPADPMPVATATTAVPMRASDDGSACPNKRTPAGEQPTSAAAAGPDPISPASPPNMLTIR